MLVVTIGSKLHSGVRPQKATCALFLPYPVSKDPCTDQHLKVTFNLEPVDEDKVMFDVLPDKEKGLPPKVALPVDQNDITLQLILESKETKHVISGFIILSEEGTSTACRFNNPIELDKGDGLSDVHVTVEQISGYPANDGKQINILTGQCSCRCKCPCSVYHILLDNMNELPE